ncbi:hypothetical protein D3C80_738370 [compost metagenome]
MRGHVDEYLYPRPLIPLPRTSPRRGENKGHPLAPTDESQGGDIIFHLLSYPGDC